VVCRNIGVAKAKKMKIYDPNKSVMIYRRAKKGSEVGATHF